MQTKLFFVGKPEGRKPLGRPRCRWRDNNEMDFKVRVWKGVDWIYLAQDRVQRRALVNMVGELRIP